MPRIGISTVIIWHMQTRRLTQPRPIQCDANEPDATVHCTVNCTTATKVANQATINSLIVDGVGLNDSLGHEQWRIHRCCLQ